MSMLSRAFSKANVLADAAIADIDSRIAAMTQPIAWHVYAGQRFLGLNSAERPTGTHIPVEQRLTAEG